MSFCVHRLQLLVEMLEAGGGCLLRLYRLLDRKASLKYFACLKVSLLACKGFACLKSSLLERLCLLQNLECFKGLITWRTFLRESYICLVDGLALLESLACKPCVKALVEALLVNPCL